MNVYSFSNQNETCTYILQDLLFRGKEDFWLEHKKILLTDYGNKKRNSINKHQVEEQKLSKSTKNILIVGVGVAMYLFTAYVYKYVSVFAEPLDQLYQSDSAIVQGFANLMILLLFTPALRVISLLICLLLLVVVNKKRKTNHSAV